ncbi:MAG: helix-turn-helix domain-containing protein [Acidobacteriia bacterium]|nr:helix-turn-helix domain-containing protein [Terriglobia bacterium]
MKIQTAPSPDGCASSRSSLGLKSLRSEAGLGLEQISDATKINMNFLRAIENEEFHLLPGGIFTISYLRQYAEAIGCDAGELLEAAGCGLRKPPVSEGRDGPESSTGRRSETGILRIF